MSQKASMTQRNLSIWLYRAVGAGIAIALMEMLAGLADEPLARVPFVTSIVLTLSSPETEAARPEVIVLGHLLSSLAGFAALWCLGAGTTAAAVGVGLAALLMLCARAVHPPAGINGFLVPLLGLPLGWVVSPVLIGAMLLAIFATFWSRSGLRLFGDTPKIR
jgi:CBS-domain-containing membrane protein